MILLIAVYYNDNKPGLEQNCKQQRDLEAHFAENNEF
jgi:hypothetical protein